MYKCICVKSLTERGRGLGRASRFLTRQSPAARAAALRRGRILQLDAGGGPNANAAAPAGLTARAIVRVRVRSCVCGRVREVAKKGVGCRFRGAYVCWRISETRLTKAVSTLDESLAEASMNCRPCFSANRWAVSVETTFLGMSHLLPTRMMLGLFTRLDDDEP